MKKLMLLFFVIFIASCNKFDDSYDENNKTVSNKNPSGISNFDHSLYLLTHKKGNNSKEIMRQAILELTEITKKMSKDARSEIFELTKNKYYLSADKVVGLKDLLNEKSDIYKFTSNLKNKNIFKKEFYKYFNSNIYPNLHSILSRNNNKNQLDFYDNAEIYYHLSYEEDDNGNYFTEDDQATYVPAVIDGDSGIGYIDQGNNNYTTMVVDDNYAANHSTIIIEPIIPPSNIIDDEPENGMIAVIPGTIDNTGGGNGSVSNGNIYDGICENLEEPDQSFTRQVFLGHVHTNKQWDRWISFSGNGGGSEFMVTRTDSKPHLINYTDGRDVDITTFDGVFGFQLSRRCIRRMKRNPDLFYWVGGLWDSNWECSNPTHEQLLFIYEDDNTEDINFEFSGIKWGDATYGQVNLSVDVTTKDAWVKKIKRDSDVFFASNLIDNGGGFVQGEYSFSDKNWPVYDYGSNFSYTMPHRWLPLNN